MNVALLAVDSNYPNLALMKISAYHKGQGDTVEWYNPFGTYDRLYMAKVFLLRLIMDTSLQMYVARLFAVEPDMTSIPPCPER